MISLCGFSLVSAAGQVQACPPRPAASSVVTDPLELASKNGLLAVDLTMLNTIDPSGNPQYCYAYSDTAEAPVLRVNPGDRLVIRFKNSLTAATDAMPGTSHEPAASPCAGGAMSSASTNIHFHGMNIPPTCHQDDVINTNIQPTDPVFQYHIRIPKDDPPGLYWYHPHPHGFTATQVIGGAAGALIIDGIEQVVPEAAGLPERVLVVRQVKLNPPGAIPPPDNDAAALSLNFVPALEKLRAPKILIKPSEKQLWRVVNASSIYFLALQLQIGNQAEQVQVIALDGIPLPKTRLMDTVVIPPAGRAEFIVQGPPLDIPAQLVNVGFDTGPGGDPNPAGPLADVVASTDAPDAPHRLPAASKHANLTRFAGLSTQKPSAHRNLYFSEKNLADGSTQFFITVKGQRPRLYDPAEPPAIVTHQGAIEDWTIENHTTEVHAFHLHQLHFVVIAVNGKAVHDPALRDTVVVPYWDGQSKPYTSITVRVDFRDPETVGTFLYHCHILDHEDGGMMAKIRVLPAAVRR
jgi:FtsP/CotA-like multicopper oxidase with cupredoxin domain